jgi:hypothetical protein
MVTTHQGIFERIFSKIRTSIATTLISPIAHERWHRRLGNRADVHDFDVHLDAIRRSEIEAAHDVKPLIRTCCVDGYWVLGHQTLFFF